MNTGWDRERLSFIGVWLPPAFARRVVTVAPGSTLAYHDADWRGAIVVIEHGQIEIEQLGGDRRSFRCGDIFWLDGLRVRALHNCSGAPAVLVAVSRQTSRPDR